MDNLNLFDKAVNLDIINTMNNSLCNAMLSTSAMNPMGTLDSAEVRAGRCPICKADGHLEHVQGFLVCPRCGINYKIFENKVYIIDYIPEELQNMSLNEIMLHSMGPRAMTKMNFRNQKRLIRKAK